MTVRAATLSGPVSAAFGGRRAWTIAILAAAAVLAVPLATVAAHVLVPTGEVWRHLFETVLADYVANSIGLAVGVAAGALVIGVGAAWLTAMCRFPGRGVFEWALLLPMALPAYIVAYTYAGMLDVAGPVQAALREAFGWRHGDYFFPEVRSPGGAVAVLALVLYPYVYLLARAAFLELPTGVLDAARTLGRGPWRTFAEVALPLARPGIVAGTMLVMMETLADYGTVKHFGVSTFTTGIVRTWTALGSAAAAAQLSAVLMAFVAVLIALERAARRGARFADTARGGRRDLRAIRLTGWRAAAAAAFCLAPVTLGFAVPAAQLAVWSVSVARTRLDAEFMVLVWNTVRLGAVAALAAVALAVAFGYVRRLVGSTPVRAATGFAALGYAVPGTVVAIGVVIPFAWFDRTLDSFMRAEFGISTGLVLGGSLAGLVFACTVRFLAVAMQAVDAGLARITPAFDAAALSLGCRPAEVARRVHLPLLRGSVLTAALLVFVDAVKELPATLILRPFNFNTLAVRVHDLASDERLADAAPAALAIVAAGILPVVVLSRAITRSRRFSA